MAGYKLDKTTLLELPEWFLRLPSSAAILNVCSNYQMFIKEIQGNAGILVAYVDSSGDINTNLFKGNIRDNEINIYNHFCTKSEDIIFIINLETKTLLEMKKQLTPIKH